MLTGFNILQQTLLPNNENKVEPSQNKTIEQNLLMNCIVGQFGYDAKETVCERGTKFCKVVKLSTLKMSHFFKGL